MSAILEGFVGGGSYLSLRTVAVFLAVGVGLGLDKCV